MKKKNNLYIKDSPPKRKDTACSIMRRSERWIYADAMLMKKRGVKWEGMWRVPSGR